MANNLPVGVVEPWKALVFEGIYSIINSEQAEAHKLEPTLSSSRAGMDRQHSESGPGADIQHGTETLMRNLL